MVIPLALLASFTAGIICGGWWMLSHINGMEDDAK